MSEPVEIIAATPADEARRQEAQWAAWRLILKHTRENLPYSGLQRIRRTVLGRRSDEHKVPVFCAGCGAEGGRVTEGSYISYLCDECVWKYGSPPLPQIPDHIVNELVEGAR